MSLELSAPRHLTNGRHQVVVPRRRWPVAAAKLLLLAEEEDDDDWLAQCIQVSGRGQRHSDMRHAVSGIAVRAP